VPQFASGGEQQPPVPEPAAQVTQAPPPPPPLPPPPPPPPVAARCAAPAPAPAPGKPILPVRVARIREALALAPGQNLVATSREAATTLGLDAGGALLPLVNRVEARLAELGLCS